MSFDFPFVRLFGNFVITLIPLMSQLVFPLSYSSILFGNTLNWVHDNAPMCAILNKVW